MKNKKNIKILAPLVLIIWGLIGYRIVKTIQGNQSPVLPLNPTAGISIAKEADTSDYVLKLNYTDPFLKGRRNETPPPSSEQGMKDKKIIRKQKEVKEQKIVWPPIAYRGVIERSNSNAVLCLLEMNGHSLIMKRGQTLNEVKLLEVYGDSVKLEYKGKEKRNFKKG